MPDPVALAYEDREYRRSELAAQVNGLAATLTAIGARRGDRVALMSSNRPEFVMALYAIWRIGAAVVLLSPSWKHTELARALELTGPRYAVGDQPLLAEQMPMLHLDDPITGVADTAQVDMLPGDDAVFVFSSGTSGLPKAVRHTRGSFDAAVAHWADALRLGPADRLQIATPPSHILGLLNIATVLDRGGWLRLHRRFDVDTLLRHIESDRITVEMAVAPIAMAIAAHPNLESYDLSSLRFIMWCATPVTPSIADTVTRRTGVGWVTAYGASELPVLACNDLTRTRLDTVGRPPPGVRLKVVSTDTGAPLGPGESGEIWAQSDSVMAQYLPVEDTAAAFVDGWYRTGDIGHLDDDGYLYLTDRAKEMIKVRGFQVAPAEVERVLLGHPAVGDCAVFGVPDATDGEAIIAAVTTCAPVEPAELIELVRDALAHYKCPREIVEVPEIPRLPSGKVLRRVLKERHGCTSDQ